MSNQQNPPRWGVGTSDGALSVYMHVILCSVLCLGLMPWSVQCAVTTYLLGAYAFVDVARRKLGPHRHLDQGPASQLMSLIGCLSSMLGWDRICCELTEQPVMLCELSKYERWCRSPKHCALVHCGGGTCSVSCLGFSASRCFSHHPSTTNSSATWCSSNTDSTVSLKALKTASHHYLSR